MKIIRTIVVTTALAAGAAYLSYRFVIRPDARDRVDKALGALRDSYLRVNDIVEGMTGIVMDEPKQDLRNRTETMKQWADLGYGEA